MVTAPYPASAGVLTTYLEVLNAPGFNRVTARRELKMQDVTRDPGLLLVTAPLADRKMSEAVSGLFLSQFISAQLKQFNTDSRPVLLVLDEAPRLQERLDLPQLMATSRSSGLSVLLALQEITDFEEKDRDTILSNCVTHILLPGAGAPTTEYFGKRIGTRSVARQTQSMTTRAVTGRRSRPASRTPRCPSSVAPR
ncbi:TraM recognition domain-containing protein [Blastococcus sp. SYSU DS0617]